MEIRLCRKEEVETVGALYDRAVRELKTHINYPRWRYGEYPSVHSAAAAQEKGELFVALQDGLIVGAFVLNDDPAGRYDLVPWRIPAAPQECRVFHALAVDPPCAGCGIGRAMVLHGIETARAAGCRAVRLDVVPGNLPAIALYTSLGFTYVATMDIHRGFEDIPLFEMYELAL